MNWYDTRWVKCSEALPTLYEYVLGYYGGGNPIGRAQVCMVVVSLNIDKKNNRFYWGRWGGGIFGENEIICWMPLPSGPCLDEEEKKAYSKCCKCRDKSEEKKDMTNEEAHKIWGDTQDPHQYNYDPYRGSQR